MKLALPLILAILLIACGPPFEEGQVTRTEWVDPPEYYHCQAVYTYQYDWLSDSFQRAYAGEDCRWIKPRAYWVITVAGVNDEGEALTHDARLYLPFSHQPAVEGDWFSLVEMKVINE